jgi:hypothetical protein
MRCVACDTERQPGSWLCPNCGTPIPKPPKPPYKARGWEWAAALACLALFWFFQHNGFPEYRGNPAVAFLLLMLCLTPFGAGPAFAFSAARDKRRAPMVVGCVCMVFWILLFGEPGWPALFLFLYIALILTLERILWWVKVARM